MPAEGRLALDRGAQLGLRGPWGRREQRLLAMAERQHRVVSFAQLRSLGFSGAAVRRRVATGRLHALHRGVYALGRPDVPLEGHWMAAVLACGEGALLSHRSAASLHELLRDARPVIDVTISRRGGLARPGIRLHRPTCLAVLDRTSVDGIPCTSVPRTLFDLAAVVPLGVLERACDQAEVHRVLDMAAVDELLARSRGRRGVRALRAVLGAGDVGENIPRSKLERRFLALCRRAGLPAPAVNQWMTIGSEEMQVDFVWRGQRVLAETDGFNTHRTRQAFQRDRRRDQLFAIEGWNHARFTWDEVADEPAHVTRVLSDLLSFGAKPTASTP